MGVSTKHPEYNKHLPNWEKTRDCVEGSASIKARGVTYLPKPNPSDKSDENAARYNDYRQRANFVNFTGPTLNGLVGMVFRNDIEVELPGSMEEMEDSVNDDDITLDQITRRIVAEVITCGRVGILADYSVTPGEGITKATASQYSPSLIVYRTEQIINWKKGEFIVLEECVEKYEDFAVITEKQYRVLRLVEGKYQVDLYNEGEELIDSFSPRDHAGKRLDYIPFVIAGTENNDLNIDKSLLYDIAEINIAHYRNSADFEESSYMVGQPTPWVSGLSQGWIKDILGGTIKIGSRGGIMLPDGGAAGLLQVTDNQMPERGMEAKETQLVKVGARIIADTATNETAVASRTRTAGQTSPLSTLVGNVESAITLCLHWVQEFTGDSGEIIFNMNREFYDARLDAQTLMAHIALLDRGVIAMSDLRNNMRQSGVIENDRTDEEIEGEAEQIGISPGIGDEYS